MKSKSANRKLKVNLNVDIVSGVARIIGLTLIFMKTGALYVIHDIVFIILYSSNYLRLTINV